MSIATRNREPTESRRATYQDVLDAPAHRVAEIVDGTSCTHPRPAPPGGRTGRRRAGSLGDGVRAVAASARR